MRLKPRYNIQITSNPRTRTRTNTNPNDTKASAADRRGVRVCSANGTCENQGAGSSPSQRARHLFVVRTLEIHRGRRLTCGARSSIIAEVKNDLSTHKEPCAPPPGKSPDKTRAPPPQPYSCSEARGPQKSTSHQWAA